MMSPTLSLKLLCFDNALCLLREHLSFALPDLRTCPDADYVSMERSWFHDEIHVAITQMLARTEHLVNATRRLYLPVKTEHFDNMQIGGWLSLFDSRRHLLSPEDNDSLDRLADLLLKLVNLNLTDEECNLKWDVLREDAKLRATTLSIKVGSLDKEFDEEFDGCTKISDEQIRRFALTHPASKEDLYAFVLKHFSANNTRPKPEFSPVTDTFRYKWFDTNVQQLTDFQARLINLGWIDKDNPIDDFCACFSGGKTTVNVIWTGTKQHLAYLISRLMESGFVSAPNSKMHWTIARSHFVAPDGTTFDDLRNQHEPKKERETIIRMVQDLEAPLAIPPKHL